MPESMFHWELSSVCVVDAQGKIVRETKVASEPEALVAFFASLGFAMKRIGLEAGPLSQWLHAGLKRAGFDTLLLETRHVKAALSAMMVKTDRKDARGLAQLIRMGWFRPVHAKSMGSQEVRALLVARKQLLGRLIDVELSIRGILRGFGLKVGVVTRKGFEGRIRELVSGHITLERIAGAMLSARATLKVEYEKLHKIVLTIVREDAVCRRLMTVPSVGPLVAITYKTAMDDPNRIAKSKAAGALFGLTPKKYQSGEKDVTGGITRAGDEMARTATGLRAVGLRSTYSHLVFPLVIPAPRPAACQSIGKLYRQPTFDAESPRSCAPGQPSPVLNLAAWRRSFPSA